MSLFARHGYAAVSMRQIAGQVGLQVGALYNYTPDKQTLLFSLLRNHMSDLLAVRAAREIPDGPLARLEDFTRFHIRYHHARPEAVFIAYMELRNLTPENFETIEGLRRQYEQELGQILADGAQAGVFDVPDTRVASFALIAMLTGVNTWFRDSGPMTLDEVETTYWDMARRAVTLRDIEP